jgi:hypothetical protein
MIRRLLVVALSLSLFAPLGCSSGSRDQKAGFGGSTAPSSGTASGSTAGGSTAGGSTAGGSTAGGGQGGADVTGAAAVTPTPAGPAVVGLVLDVAASGSDATLDAITVQASGSVDETTAVGGLVLIGDDNRNGVADPGEPTLATLPGPAFTADDGSATIALTSPVTIAAGASLQVLVAAEMPGTGSVADVVGETLELGVATAADVALTSGGQPLVPNGVFPTTGGRVQVYAGDHLMISEVHVDGDEQFLELFNPTALPLDLTDVYYTDATDGYGTGQFYWNLPSGADFGPENPISDFLVRFPAGATIQSGEVIVVATDATAFEAAFGQAPDYCLRNPGATGAAQMLSHDGAGWVAQPVDTYVELSPFSEIACLFRWDNTSDLVEDVDYLFFGPGSSVNFAIDKTGVSVDGPDGNSTPETYLPDTPAANQAGLTIVAGQSFQRIDWAETGEATSGGNGASGHDETSEPWATTFTTAAPTPGAP